MATPVSWLLIEPGWHVEVSDGSEVGHVEEVTGDSGADIFDGLSVAAGALAKPRYVPAEQVGEIVDGRVRLKLDRAGFDALGEFLEPSESVEVEPEKASIVARTENAVEGPFVHSSRTGVVRRALEWLGLAGRR